MKVKVVFTRQQTRTMLVDSVTTVEEAADTRVTVQGEWLDEWTWDGETFERDVEEIARTPGSDRSISVSLPKP